MSYSVEESRNDFPDEGDARYKLKDSINVKDLTTNFGTILEIDTVDTFDHALEQDWNEHDYDTNKDYFSMGKDQNGEEIRGCPGKDSFETIAQRMTNILNNGKVKKRILREGNGPPVPPGSEVKVHYNAFFEFSDDPFDSSFLQGKPQKFSLDNCIEGLSIAISTMLKNERAHFLVHHDLAYREMGVPPRIPQNATILYEVELLNFTEVDETSDGLKKKKTFAEVMSAARTRCHEGNACFENKDFRGAQFQYHKVMRMLEKLNLANEEEEVEQERMLLKVYTNLAACYVKENLLRQACNMCKCALHINSKHVKAIFLFGRALLLLGDFEAARTKLQKANQLKPGDIDIKEELAKVDKKKNEYLQNEKMFTRKMFS